MSALDDYNSRREHERKRRNAGRPRRRRHVARELPCAMCGDGPVEMHHIVPRSKFGKGQWEARDSAENLLPLCHPCHQDHHTTHRRVPRDVLTPSQITFAAGHTSWAWMDLWYPMGAARGTRA